MKLKVLLVVSMLTAMSSAMANEYSFGEETYQLSFSKGAIKTSHCVKKDQCFEAESEVKTLIETLEKSLTEYKAMLADPGKIESDAKSQANSATQDKIVEDKASGKKYIMISFGNNFNLPLDSELIEKGDFSLVVAAIQANHDRYLSAIDMLKSGKAPAKFSTDDYSKISPIASLHNIVMFSKYL